MNSVRAMAASAVGSNKWATVKRVGKRVLIRVGMVLGLALLGLGIYATRAVAAYSASMAKVYDVPIPVVARSSDPAIIERGRHLAEGIAGCANPECHGTDLSGGRTLQLGPIGFFTGPNLTAAGFGGTYSDGELRRLVRHGIKRDGRSLQFMPVQDFRWLPDNEVAAIISYLRSIPPVTRPNGETRFSVLAKVLDRRDEFTLDVARRIDHQKTDAVPPAPAPTAEYGQFLADACRGCHGEHLSGGHIPGAPPSIPIPLNLTPDATGLAGWNFEDFERLLATRVRRNGKTLDPFMPAAAYDKLDSLEKHALWAYLQSLPPEPFGQR